MEYKRPQVTKLILTKKKTQPRNIRFPDQTYCTDILIKCFYTCIQVYIDVSGAAGKPGLTWRLNFFKFFLKFYLLIYLFKFFQLSLFF